MVNICSFYLRYNCSNLLSVATIIILKGQTFISWNRVAVLRVFDSFHCLGSYSILHVSVNWGSIFDSCEVLHPYCSFSNSHCHFYFPFKNENDYIWKLKWWNSRIYPNDNAKWGHLDWSYIDKIDYRNLGNEEEKANWGRFEAKNIGRQIQNCEDSQE